MPLLEPVVLEGRGYELRHIGPRSVLYAGGGPSVAVTNYVLLNQPTMVARELPITNSPISPDFAQGQWTMRLGDAGDYSLTFPNKDASDGMPWRNRFASDGKNQWIEIRNDGYPEFVGCIEDVDSKRDQIVITGHDGFFQTKNAYERDWVTVQAPRDVIERGTQVWVPITVDNFPAGSLNAQWTVVNNGVGSSSVLGTSGGLNMKVGAGGIGGPHTEIDASPSTSNIVWNASCTFINTSTNLDCTFSISDPTSIYTIRLDVTSQFVNFQVNGNSMGIITLPLATSYTLFMESDGEWVSGFINGQFISIGRRIAGSPSGSVVVKLTSGTGTLVDIHYRCQLPFLMSGSDKGDYVLPGNKSTYPSGGLHARYHNDLDLQTDGNRLARILNPTRTIAYKGSGGPGEYANQQDPVINVQGNPVPGAASSNWSVLWFGSIYLKWNAGSGTYTFQVNIPGGATTNYAVRIWIGKTRFQDELTASANWSFSSGLASAIVNITAASLAGTLPYSGGKITRDGWYPIKIEYAVDSTAGVAPAFFLTNSPTAYTDPGGTVIASGAQATIVPSTSLSPLGMVDERHQGISHFDLIQKTALAAGYQFAVEPQTLESNVFPGVLAPRIREGQDYDAILEPDDQARNEGLINYSNKLDATDIATSIRGNGAGFQNGNTGQLQAEVFDPVHLKAALFDIQAWQDFSDASFATLLQALLNSRLGLQLDPWQVITGDPIGRPRLANLWPLPSKLAQMRWRAGDGLKVYARDVNIQDVTPRQLLVMSRQIHPNGSTGAQVSFASRPRSATHAIKQALFQATRWQRNYQKQLVTLSGSYVIPTIAFGTDSSANGFPAGYSVVSTSANDQVVNAYVRITSNNGAVSLNILVNGVDVTSTLNGPWTTIPFDLPLNAVAKPDANGRIYVNIKNNSGAVNSAVSFQLFVDVLR